MTNSGAVTLTEGSIRRAGFCFGLPGFAVVLATKNDWLPLCFGHFGDAVGMLLPHTFAALRSNPCVLRTANVMHCE